jgi:hypothetical protein
MSRAPAFLLGVGVGAFLLILWALVYIGFSLVKIDNSLTGDIGRRYVTKLPTNRL